MKWLILIAAITAAQGARACDVCGCRGGPGYRGPDNQCVSWRKLNSVCGVPPTSHCMPEHVNERKEDQKSDPQ